jgi:tetratricopeptide (TPR) repeat protein
MKPSVELFQLIKSLSKSEKRFFKLTSSLQSGDKNYLKIFDAIDKQKEYDEDAIKKQFAGETFIKHFPSEKNHLYKLILKSLRSFHADNSISSMLKHEIKNIEILYKKALFKECNKFLHRAKKIAKSHEKFYYWFELISWEKQLLEEAYEAGEFDKNLDELIQEEQLVIEKLRNLAEYQMLYSKINYLYRSGGFARNESEKKEVDKITNYPLIKGKNTALSTRAATICYYVKGLCSATNRDYETSFGFFLKVKEILDNNPLIKKDLAKRYVRTLSNLLYCYIDNNNYEASFDLIQKMRVLHKEKGFGSTDVQVKIFTASYIAELLIYDRMGEYDKALEIVDAIVEGMDEFGEKINKEQEIVFYYNLAYVYFGAGQYNKALFWINKVLNDNEQTLRQDIYSFSRLFNLVIHFELGNNDLLEYIIKSTYRYLNKHKRDYEVETVLLKHLKKLARMTTEEQQMEQFLKMREELDELFKDNNERVVLEYFDFLAWLESKISGIPFADAARKRGQTNLVNQQ